MNKNGRRLLPKQKITVLAVAAALVIIVLSFASGYAYASFVIGSFSNLYNQSASSGNPAAPTGVTFTSAMAQIASLTSPASTAKCASTDSSSSSSPDSLTAGSTAWVCLNSVATTGYGATDTIEAVSISWGTTASTSTTYELSVYIGGATSSATKAYVSTPATIGSAATAMITFDLTSGGVTTVSSVTVIVSQCSGSTCP